ncbi:helix-turn-helix transcriptional regulator [Alkaliphilus peptidifermentans]|uniref:WYL domain-containing protein n=1 Tax=Alkaliphilus peptidifermentans DSM 18978 TaxID=1120976 RepID=A0A1G5EBG4_9FIRM|nr:WYL domain-containing protein [Alkaliphilus peptidifermentans]SCY24245.1 WYL domain-containing protein [Alkaliphilus peptidifermentans DSM 18978]
MNTSLDYNGNKGFRLLSMYEGLNKGELLCKRDLAEKFGVAQKTIQRDIEDLRAYLSENHYTENEVAIKYDKTRKGYFLVRFEREWLTNEEVMAILKILLESRAFCKEELNRLINKLLNQVVPNDRKKVEQIIKNEQLYYEPLKHGKKLLSILWELSQLILNCEITKFTYTRQDGIMKEREVKPVAIMFSEYYFYLIAYMADGSKDFPTVFRIDRINDLEGTKQQFNIPYKDKFNDGEFRKRVQFMYSGELRKVKFEFLGPSIEAVLDKLPTAEIIAQQNGVYTISAEVYGNGINMWLRSQGDMVKEI